MPTCTSRPLKYGLIVGAVVAAALALGLQFHNRIGVGGGAEEYPISWFIIVSALLGSLVNQPFRHSEIARSTVGWLLIYLLWKSAVAIVFAFVLYMMFIAGLISGDMFPRFINTTAEGGGKYVSMKAFATTIDPESYKDVAKILVWSFVAGYSEKFVPNLVGKILSLSEGSGNKGDA
jgi:hypothetical protein